MRYYHININIIYKIFETLILVEIFYNFLHTLRFTGKEKFTMKNELFDMMLYISSVQQNSAEFCDKLKTMNVEDVYRYYNILKQKTDQKGTR